MLLQTSFPPDIRVENEILSLTKMGGQVHLLCRNSGHQDKNEFWNQALIHRLVSPGLSKGLRSLFQIPVFLNPVWFTRAIRLIRRYDIQVVQVHDLPLAPTALLLRFFCGVKTIYDMHENYPAALRSWKKTGVEYYLKHPMIFKMIERFSLPHFDRLIAVVDENRDRVTDEYDFDPDHISVVSNYVNTDTFTSDVRYESLDLPLDARIFLYTGGLDNHRGLDITLKAFRLLCERHQDIFLLIVGGGRSGAGKQTENVIRESIAADPVLSEQVRITGWIDVKYVPGLIERSQYCLIPQGSNDHTDTTIPHKVFQYSLFGKPVVAADAKPMKRIVQDSGMGIIFRTDSVESYLSALEEVLDIDYEKVSKRTREETLKRFTWVQAELALFKLYESLGITTDG